jgi:hypothetical protein
MKARCLSMAIIPAIIQNKLDESQANFSILSFISFTVFFCHLVFLLVLDRKL